MELLQHPREELRMSAGTIVDSRDLNKLIPQALPIAYWLKENAPDGAGDLLSKPNLKGGDQECLNQLLKALDATTDNLTNSQLRYVLSNYKAPNWGWALQSIICNSDPPIIPESTQRLLLESGGTIDFRSLSQLGHRASTLLGEVLSALKYSSKDFRRNASYLAPRLFRVSNKVDDRKKTAVLIQLISRCDELFGQSATMNGPVSFGVRPKLNDIQWNLIHTLPPTKKRRQDLRTFFSFIDRKYVGIVEELFEYHSFQDIARAIYIRYNKIPTPWKSELQRLKTTPEGRGLEWFKYDEVRTPTPGTANQGSSRDRARIDLFLAPPQIDITPTDVQVNRFLDSEKVFYQEMRKLANVYVEKLFKISRSSLQAQESLLLSFDEIENIFGQRFQKVWEFSESLLYHLEPISLLRTKVHRKEGREGILANIILKLAPADLFNHFVHYSETYPGVIALVQGKLKWRDRQKRQNAGISAFPDFVDLWHEARQKLGTLGNQTFLEMLMWPVNRVREYRKLVTDIMATVPKNSVPYPMLMRASNQLKKAATELSEVSQRAVAKFSS
eukprot:maker-scaffold_1-snap-gene-25.5-mRNA-1 protein AED:0.00 eAED:0.00 QI:57/1/1/1/1/1/3/138/557